MTDAFQKMQDIIQEAVMNTECNDPMEAVMALCCVMCDILVQIGGDEDKLVAEAVLKTLELSRASYQTQEIH